MSEGEYISLGWYEREDVKTVTEHLRSLGTVSTIGLWGRSMGAATALLHAHRDHSIAGIVCDSSFASLKQLAKELAKRFTKIPSFIIVPAMSFISSSVKSRAHFTINELNPIQYVDEAFIPALFAHADGDDFIPPHHSQDIYDKYSGEKNIVLFDGDHNSPRPDFFYDSVCIFFRNCMLLDELIKPTKVPSN